MSIVEHDIHCEHFAEAASLAATVQMQWEETDRLKDERDDWKRRAMIAEGEVDRLRTAISVHHIRKGERRCYPMPGHEGKYGCADHDMRLWSLIDAR